MPTFAFELTSYNRNNDEREGWLFGDKYNKTEYYLLAWIWADLPVKDDGKYTTVIMDEFDYDAIREVEFLIIKKEDIQEYAKKHGINETSAIIRSARMRKNEIRQEPASEHSFYPKLYYTNWLAERPVNLVIKFDELLNMSIYHDFAKTDQSKHEQITTNNSNFVICKMFNESKSIDEIADILKINQTQVVDTLLEGTKSEAVRPVTFKFTSRERTVLKGAEAKYGINDIEAIKDYSESHFLENEITYNKIKCYVIERTTYDYEYFYNF